jgi:putative endonuclease
MAFIYIVRCSDGTYYTGSARDLDKRLRDHNRGKGARYTRGRLPVELLYSEQFETMGEALSREHAIKKLSRLKKEKLIRG